ncbi:antibiotic biosynthesis monooxygenase [Celeribacter sp. HF31]|uniref:putative quinol monooxygenase n=1 Tax=Celeribacter sp. HF31 TaxID=2721558 RepID=UPI0020CA5568
MGERGCVVFDVLQDLDNGRRFTIWECWQSPKDLATHFEYPHTKAALARGMTRVMSQAKLTSVNSAIARNGPQI